MTASQERPISLPDGLNHAGKGYAPSLIPLREDLLNEFGRIAGERASIEDVLRNAVSVLARGLGVGDTFALELFPGVNVVHLAAACGWLEHVDPREAVSPTQDTVLEHTLASGATVLVSDWTSEHRFWPPVFWPVETMRGAVFVGLQGRDGPYGVLGACSRAPMQFDADALLLVQQVAGVCSAAIMRLQFREALRDAEERFHLMVEGIAGHAVFMLDPEGRVLNWNAGAHRLMGYAEDEVVGCDFGIFCTPEDRAAGIPRHALRIAAEAGTYAYQGWRFRRDGSRFWADIIITALRDERERLFSYSKVIRDATERLQMEQQLRDSQQKLVQLSRQLLDVQEHERRYLARELHDEIGQSLTALKIGLTMSRRDGGAVPPASEAESLVDDLIRRVRRLSIELRPTLLDDLGIAPALTWLCERFETQMRIEVSLNVKGCDRRFGQEVETALYRITQEALTNVARHAEASVVDVSLTEEDGCLTLSVQDDGMGFDPARPKHEAGCGLSGMRERVMLLDGQLRVLSTPGGGTSILVELPLTTANA